MDWLLALAQVFGGCCSNVFLFERLLNDAKKLPESPHMGSLVTFCQFVVVAIASAYPLIDRRSSWRRLYLRRNRIPFHKILVAVAIFFTVSVLNNSVWRFGLSVPIHIMFRSSSTVISMVVGYLFGGTLYNRGQVVSCVMITFGAILTISLRNADSFELIGAIDWRFCFGILVLATASVLGAFLGIYTENIYAKYGNHWQEMLFYTHFLGIALFGGLGRTIIHDLKTIWFASPTLTISKTRISILEPFAYLFLNCISQVICARGVNYLSGIASSLTVTTVLLVRKFVSLALSAYVFGNPFSLHGYVGAGILVIGTILYSWATLQPRRKTEKTE